MLGLIDAILSTRELFRRPPGRSKGEAALRLLCTLGCVPLYFVSVVLLCIGVLELGDGRGADWIGYLMFGAFIAVPAGMLHIGGIRLGQPRVDEDGSGAAQADADASAARSAASDQDRS